MDIRRLGWAGLELTSQDTTIAIDLFEEMGPMTQFVGEARTPLPPPSRALDAALVTHLHGDHADPPALARALKPGAPILRPLPSTATGLEVAGTYASETGIAELGLVTDPVDVWDSRTIGPFTITAVPAVDGFGDPQVSWVVEADGRRILQAGDTLFHGSWWTIPMRVGPIDVAFLPINGAVCDFPHKQPPSPLAAVMGPREAAAAARILQAGLVVPIHYDAIHGPPVYAQIDDPSAQFVVEARALGLEVALVAPGEPVPDSRVSAGSASA
jgi:L-ascorbate metabolism protein UlaG (beta-lactamase superfamily)